RAKAKKAAQQSLSIAGDTAHAAESAVEKTEEIGDPKKAAVAAAIARAKAKKAAQQQSKAE
ncbi:hypothetical protein, partial [Conservatibacter flavescens]